MAMVSRGWNGPSVVQLSFDERRVIAPRSHAPCTGIALRLAIAWLAKALPRPAAVRMVDRAVLKLSRKRQVRFSEELSLDRTGDARPNQRGYCLPAQQ